ncbi:MAG TPA: right-handed parallel beta-helix repeat-containing protein [Bryobacteraceae bacterium]|nr:right-handed parallel beta-helix repeat-containing protein [Bryobacteraceae bacterium]
MFQKKPHSAQSMPALASTTFMITLCFCQTAVAADLCVNPSGANGCSKTIQAAVTAASPNDTINVAAGTYKESVTIGKPLSLISSGASQTIIEATGLGSGIYVDGIDNKGLANVVVSGFTVQNANFEGILVTNASSVTISGNILTGNDKSLNFAGDSSTCPGIPDFETGEDFDCGEAIHLIGVDHSIVLNNTIQNNAGGILLSDDTGATHDNLIIGNNVSNNVWDCGITLASHPPAALTGSSTALGVYQNTVTNNQAVNNGTKGEGAGVGIFASAPGTAAYSNVVTNNVLTGNGIPGVAIHGHTPQQNLNNNSIIGNTISGNGADEADTPTAGPAGINVAGVSPITGTVIMQNTISQEMLAVVINAPGDARIQRNTFPGGGIGVANLRGAAVNADANFWGCAADPTAGLSGFAGCSLTMGKITVGSWLTTAPGK